MEYVSLFDKGILKDRIFKKGQGIDTCPFLYLRLVYSFKLKSTVDVLVAICWSFFICVFVC